MEPSFVPFRNQGNQGAIGFYLLPSYLAAGRCKRRFTCFTIKTLSENYTFVFQNPYLQNLDQFYGHHDSNKKTDGAHSRRRRSEEEGGDWADFAHRADPWLYPHLIEFTLIGATMAIVMFHHIGK